MVHPLLPLLVLCAAVGLLSACERPPKRPHPVGRTHRHWVDPERESWDGGEKRPLNTTIWYPAAPGSTEEPWRVAVFHAGWTAIDAELAPGLPPLPAVVLSHGTGGAALHLSWLAEALASQGFVVAAVNHHGNTAAEKKRLREGFVLWWERAQDVSVVLDRLLADPRFAGRIDHERIGVGGFSLGGYTALGTAGARTDRVRWREHCSRQPGDPACNPPPEASMTLAELEAWAESSANVRRSLSRASRSFRDARVRAAYAIAPALVPALDPSSLRRIDIPVRLVVGSEDDQVLPDAHVRPLAEVLPHSDVEVLPGASHYVFLAACGLRGRVFLPALCSDDEVDRDRVHADVGADAHAFFESAL